jgi:hypothetical protein
MFAITLYILSEQAKSSRGRSITFFYTVFMMAIGAVSLVTSLMTLEDAVVEEPAWTPSTSDLGYCSPIHIATTLASTVQFLATDSLLVRSCVHFGCLNPCH